MRIKETNAMTNWLTLEEAAKYLRMGKSTLYHLARKGNIPAHKMGREWRFDAEELDRWIKTGSMEEIQHMRGRPHG